MADEVEEKPVSVAGLLLLHCSEKSGEWTRYEPLLLQPLVEFVKGRFRLSVLDEELGKQANSMNTNFYL